MCYFWGVESRVMLYMKDNTLHKPFMQGGDAEMKQAPTETGDKKQEGEKAAERKKIRVSQVLPNRRAAGTVLWAC